MEGCSLPSRPTRPPKNIFWWPRPPKNLLKMIPKIKKGEIICGK